ncbi:hypothetical protein BGZ54_000706 [Gamsiella multidivaricata]|nr:hypothetical protein BGZ54_000706 [Gamsiella multidivaricata]
MSDKPRVMIAGAGLSGVMLAILLERINVPYMIYEKASTVKPLGSVMGFNSGTLPIFEQLGLLDDLMKFSLPTHGMEIYDESMTMLGDFNTEGLKEKSGYDTILFARLQLYEFMLSKVPSEKVSFQSKIMSIEQNHLGVMIRLQDGSTHHGDILVGADGAYSAVRQSLYKHLDKKGLLPDSDKENLRAGHLCVVATSGPLDPEKYPTVKDSISHFQRVVRPGSNHSWSTANVPGNRIAWALVTQIETVAESKDAMFRLSEWGPEGVDAMLQEYRNYKAVVGGKMGDIMDATPKDQISKVFLEEKLFTTWHHSRTVLIGDVLANCINDMADTSLQSIEWAFEDYKEQRYPIVSGQYERSKLMAKMIYGHTWHERLLRYVIFNWVPKSVQNKELHRVMSYRPQANFLPYVENRGTIPVLPPWISKRKQEQATSSSNDTTATTVPA